MGWLDDYIKQQSSAPSEYDVNPSILQALTNPQYQPPPKQSGLLDKLLQTWPARMAQSAVSAAALPGDVYAGRTNPMSQDAINRAADLGGAVMGSTFGLAPRGAIGVGPIRGFHGSPNNFDKFDMRFAGSTTDDGLLGRAMYFSTDPAVAQSKAHKYEASLNLRNPVEISADRWGADKRELITKAIGLPKNASSEEIAAAAKALGYDGAVLDYSKLGYNQKEIAVYSDDLIDILRKYGLAGATATGVAASAANAPSGDVY